MLKHLVLSLTVALMGLAHAQPVPPVAASAASAASAPAPTLDSMCGAGGHGNAMRYTAASPHRRVPIPETREASKAKPGELSSRVNASGVWESCRMPPKAKDCQPQPVPESWAGEHGRTCMANPGAMLPGRNIGPVDVTVHSRGYFVANPAPGQRRGSLTYECRKDGWVLIWQYCQ